MFRAPRFWFRDREDHADYAPELLHSGWVPQPPANTTADRAAQAITPAAAQHADDKDYLARFYANQAC